MLPQMNRTFARFWLMTLCAAVALTILSGCQTVPKVNWESRVGNFTYDQAVTELGPPDKKADLKDGTIVADWLTIPSRVVRTGGPVFYGTYRQGPVYNDIYSTPEQFLRLTFGPDSQLKLWKKVVK